VIDTFELERSEDIEAGLVVGTIPEAGTVVVPGTELTIILSDGPEDLIVPSLIGMDKSAAFVALTELGLLPTEFGQWVDDPNLVNTVVDTIPGPNSVIEPGAQIQVVTGLPSPALLEAQQQGQDQAQGQGQDGFDQGDNSGQGQGQGGGN